MVGHSTGGSEVARFLGRHGNSRVSKAVLVSAIVPFLGKAESKPNGMPMEVFDSFRAAMRADRSQYFLDVPTGPFFGHNIPGTKSSTGNIQSWWQQAMICGFKGAYDCITVFSETDMTEDLKKIDILVLLLHGESDQLVPIENGARKAVKLLKNGTLKEYPGGAHGLPNTEIDKVNADILAFLKS